MQSTAEALRHEVAQAAVSGVSQVTGQSCQGHRLELLLETTTRAL